MLRIVPGRCDIRAAAAALLGALGLLLMASGLASASEVPGQSEAAFEAAVADWLADDEAAALPAFAALAEQGNAAAQMLLALIDKTPALQGPWLSGLPRSERTALLRAPGGMSGTSWMHAAAETVPLAGHWQTLWQVDAPVSLALDFTAAGEARAARETLIVLASRERRGIAGIADDAGFPEAMRPLVWAEWRSDPELAAQADAEIAALPAGDPRGPTPDAAALGDWLLSAPVAAPVAALCTRRCGETAGACAAALYDGLGSFNVLAAFGTPSATLIAPEAFHESPCGEAALLRRVLLRHTPQAQGALLDRLAATDACLAAMLEREAQRYP